MNPNRVSQQGSWRLHLVWIAFLVVGTAVVAQMVRIQFGPQAQLFLEQGDLYAGVWETVYPARGQIYDRWGNLLAGNKTAYQIGVELREVEDPDSIAFVISAVLGEDYGEVLAKVSQEPGPKAIYVVLADYVSPEKVLQMKQFEDPAESGMPAKNLSGLTMLAHLQRSYPERDLGANVLGFVSREGVGYFGVEEKYANLLAGSPQTVWVPADPNRVESMPDIPPGASLILTIDREVQGFVEAILDQAIIDHGAEGGTIAVMDPRNGEVLAMATTPRVDLNEYWIYEDIISGATPFNPAVSKDYEPGSVFKVLTFAAALDHGAITPESEFLDTGIFEIGGITIRNWNQDAWGPQTMLGCMQHSLNVCLAWMVSRLGPHDFYGYMSDFGLGQVTGIDLAGEVSGRLKIPGDADWYAADLGTNSFGQGLSATPTQMLMAVSALANDGKAMMPHVVRAIVNNGHQFEPQPQEVSIPISSGTARTVTRMLARSLENEASVALVPGYKLAGKTGTGEIPTPYGYTSAVTNASFVGWGPVSDPQFIVYVWIEKPTSSIWGSEVAAPVFRQIVERLVIYLNIPPDGILAGEAPSFGQ